MTVPLWAWAGTLGVFAVLIAADLVFLLGSPGRRPKPRRRSVGRVSRRHHFLLRRWELRLL